MATVYSLVCWGGSTGKPTTSINDTSNVITMTDHGLRTGLATRPTAANNGLSTSTNYYVRVIDNNQFTLHLSPTDATNNANIVDLTGTTATTLKSKYYLDISDATRWGNADPASARIFGGIAAWKNGRTGVNLFDTEVLEFSEGFSERRTTTITLDLACREMLLTPYVDGAITTASHRVSGLNGYELLCTGGITGLYLNKAGTTVNELIVKIAGNTTRGIQLSNILVDITNCIIYADTAVTGCHGIYSNSTYDNCYRNLIYGLSGGGSIGVYINSSTGSQNIFSFNSVLGCASGFVASTPAVRGAYYNNVAAGNGTNWSLAPSNMEGGSNNAGSNGDTPWGTDSKTNVVADNTHFVSFSGGDFRPTSSSPLINAGIFPYGFIPSDIKGNYVPDYESATYPNNIPDIGAFEFVHAAPDGGRPPSTVPLAITNMVNGSEFAIYKTVDMFEIAAPQSTTGSYAADYTYNADTAIIVRVRKKGYLPYEYAGTITATGFALSVSQIIDPIAI